MACDIAKALFRFLSQDGIVMSDAFFRTMLPAWVRVAPAIPDFQDRLNSCVDNDNRL